MGLSNEERYANIIHSICHINGISEKLEGYRFKKLKTLVENLWFEFLKKDSNGLFWFMGSDLHNDHTMGETLTGVAFKCHVPNRGHSISIDELEKERAEKDKYYESYKILKGFCEIDRLLDGPEGASVMIYLHTQKIAYAMCRYHDEFMDKYEDLNRLMRTIQGECFRLFKDNGHYVHAWMLHNLCDKVFTMKEKDIVNQWWVKHCNSHDVKIRYEDFNKIYEAFSKYQFRDMTIQDRIEVTLLLVGNKYGEFEHQHKEFMEMVKDYNKKKENKVKIKTKPIEDAFEKGKKAKKDEYDKPYQRNCDFTDNYVDHNGQVKNVWGD